MVSDRCCICYRSVEEDRILLIQFPRGPKACGEHIRQAVAQSDCIQPTEDEWLQFSKRVEQELTDLIADGAAHPTGVSHE